jgi:hypothetical protein
MAATSSSEVQVSTFRILRNLQYRAAGHHYPAQSVLYVYATADVLYTVPLDARVTKKMQKIKVLTRPPSH